MHFSIISKKFIRNRFDNIIFASCSLILLVDLIYLLDQHAFNNRLSNRVSNLQSKTAAFKKLSRRQIRRTLHTVFLFFAISGAIQSTSEAFTYKQIINKTLESKEQTRELHLKIKNLAYENRHLCLQNVKNSASILTINQVQQENQHCLNDFRNTFEQVRKIEHNKVFKNKAEIPEELINLIREIRKECLDDVQSKSRNSELTINELNVEKRICFDDYNNAIEKIEAIQRKTHFKERKVNKNSDKRVKAKTKLFKDMKREFDETKKDESVVENNEQVLKSVPDKTRN